jgi:hypothetical protein
VTHYVYKPGGLFWVFLKQPHCSKMLKKKRKSIYTDKSHLMDNMKFESFSINQCLKVKLAVSLHEKTAAVCSTPKYQMKAQKYAGQTPIFKFLYE